MSSSDYTETGTYDKDDVAGSYTLTVGADTMLALDDVSTTLNDEMAGTLNVDLTSASTFGYTDTGVDSSDENAPLNFTLSASETTTLTVAADTAYARDDEEATSTTNTNVTLESTSTTAFTGSGSFTDGDTSGTFALASSTTNEILFTDIAVVTSFTHTDVELGKITETTLTGNTDLEVTFTMTSTQSSEFTTVTILGNYSSSSEGTTGASTTVSMNITGTETYSGTATTYHDDDDEFESSITSSGTSDTIGSVNSTVTYHEEGTSSDSTSSGDYDTDTNSAFATDLTSTTDIDITGAETSGSTWNLTRAGNVLGSAYINSDSETILAYDSEFEFGMTTNSVTTGPSNTLIDIDTVVLSTSISEVDSTHSTDDFYEVERALVSGAVVETITKDYSGQFSTDAEMSSGTATDVDGLHHRSGGGSSGGGGGGPPGGPGGPSSSITFETNITWTDDRDSSTTTTASQSGSYGDGENDSSSSSLTVVSVDEFFSTLEGDDSWEFDGYSASTDFTHQSEGSTQRQFGDTKSFSSSGNTASWSSSYSTENSWSVHAEITEFGYTIIVDDSDSDSYSESSGGISYTPGEGDNPSGSYRPMDGSSGGGGEGGTNANEADEIRGALRTLKQFFENRSRGAETMKKLPYFSNGERGPVTKNLFMYDWMLEEGRQNGFLTLAGDGFTTGNTKPDG